MSEEHVECINFLIECLSETDDDALKAKFDEHIQKAIQNFKNFLESQETISGENLSNNKTNKFATFDQEAYIFPKKWESFLIKNKPESDNAKNCESDSLKIEKEKLNNFEKNDHKNNKLCIMP